MYDAPSRLALVSALLPIALRAGEVIMEVYNTPFAVETKGDNSPVTEADQKGEAVILEGLKTLTPDVTIVAEESVAAGRIPTVGDAPFWLVDPLDGTKEFVKRNGEFTVNIGLIVNRVPVLGIVHCPALGTTYLGADPGTARMIEADGSDHPISCRVPPEEGITVLGSRSHGTGDAMDRFLADYTVKERIAAGSSLKFCRLAEGIADLYPRLGPTCEWDTAAAHALLLSAGGSVTTLDGAPLTYAKRADFLNPHFIAQGLPAGSTVAA
ncbi:3'(2'),5'-bisphosphate nucleotidase CysQ [Rhodospirillum sp. A1_3_36]|uniref:3'(2'),5'-bisphosphate nucleotidase CysQ n=1 Tax=Rhodospirillum sp. A1_3_36 TaxID=3391666 RepID=UPI0039A4E531